MSSRQFRALCGKLRTAIKALSADDRAALGTSATRFASDLRINASDFLGLCARLGIDPVTGQSAPPVRDPGPLCLPLVGAGCAMQRALLSLSLRSAADRAGVSYSTLRRLEQNLPVSIESVLAVCQFIGVHPFGYLASEKRRAA